MAAATPGDVISSSILRVLGSARHWSRPRRRVAIATALLTIAVGAVAYVRVVRPVEVHARRAERGDVTVVVFGRGTLESRREAQLGFDLVGRVSDVEVDDGDAIQVGQTLARLAPDQFEAGLETARSGKTAARAVTRRLDVELRRAREALAYADNEERRIRGLVAAGTLPGAELDLAMEQALLARAGAERVLAQRAEAAGTLAAAGGLEQEQRVVTARSAIVAPFDGVVLRRLRDPGDVVTVGATVLRVAATDRVWVRAWIDETALGLLAEGDPVTVALPGATTTGRVDRIGREADRQTHEVLVEAALDSVPARFALGQRADVWIEVDRRRGVIRIPVAFLRRDGRGAYCDVARDGRIARARVTTGAFGRDDVEIVAGLDEDDVVLRAIDPRRPLPRGRRFSARAP